MAVWKKSITGEAIGPKPKTWQIWFARVLGTGLGTGYAPVAQGTLGSALFVLIWFWIVPDSLLWQVAVVLGVHFFSIVISGWGERLWGEDPGRITIDEFAGQSIALFMVPRSWLLLFTAFLLFRIFDTFKFTFVRKHIETLHGGWGVTLDDTVAGIVARILMIPVVLSLAAYAG